MDGSQDAPADGEVCLVTGGGSGIGRSIAHRFARDGMRIVIVDVEQAALDATVEALGGEDERVLALCCDVRSPDQMATARERTLDHFGDIHLVCLNAGVAPSGPILDTPIEVWDWVFDVNVRGILNGVHAFGPLLARRGRGHIVCTASAAGLTDTPSIGAYGATKHAVIGLAAALRHELSAAGVGVSVVCPGMIDTKIFESERNRPAGMADPSVDNPTAAVYRDLLAAVGASPDDVAEMVRQAVVDDQFFVFPTTDFDEGIDGRIATIRQGLEWRDRVRADLGLDRVDPS